MARSDRSGRQSRFFGFLQAILAILVLTTCSGDTSTGPGHLVRSRVDASALLTAAGSVPITIDQVFVELRRVSDNSVAFSRTLNSSEFGQNATSLIIDIQVELHDNPEDFTLFLQAIGGGTVYYEVNGTVTATANQSTSTSPLTPTYVGPGVGADSVVISLSSGYATGGASVTASAVVYSNNQPVPGVPVGFTSSDLTKVAAPVQTGLAQAQVTAPGSGADSVVITAVTAMVPALTDTATFHYIRSATRIVKVSGDLQSAGTGALFGQPLVVEVRDATGAPFKAGYPVTFAVSSGPTGTSVTPLNTITDAAGQATASLTAGSVAGAISVTATAGTLNGSPITFGATVTGTGPGSPANVLVSAGNNQTAAVNSTLPVNPAVLVTDANSIPLQGIAVVFAVTGGGGSATGLNRTTNASGIATVGSWTLGQATGTNTLSATVTGLTPASFTATGIAGPAAVVAKVSGDNQSANTNTPLANPLVVAVNDQFGNPLNGATVNWVASDGNLSAPTSQTGVNGQAQISWTLGALQASPTVTATVGAFSAVFNATTIFPTPQILLSQSGVPGVGVGLTATVNVALSGPAGAGGVSVALSSANQSIFTVAPSAVNIPQGQNSGTATITGVSPGTANLDATATGYIAGSLSIDVQNRNISIPPTLNVPYGQTASLPIQLPAPAPVGGVTFTVSSSAPTLVGVLTPSVTVAAGNQTANATLSGLLPGPSTVTVDNPAFLAATSTVTTAAALNIVQGSALLNASFTAQVDVDFTSSGQGIAAPAPGVALTPVITDPTCLAATSPTIPTGLVSAPVTLSYGGTATLPCTTQFKITAPNIQPDSINVTVQATPGITVNVATVGSGLQVAASGNLGASNHGGTTVTLTSADPNLLLAPNATSTGSSSVNVFVPNNQTFFNYVIQAKEGLTGTTPVNVTASATGFANGVGTMSLVQGAIDLINVPSTTTTLTPWNAIYARTGIPNSQTTPAFLNQLQAVRFGAPGPVTVSFEATDLNGAVTLVKTGGVQADTLTASVPVTGTNTPTDTTSGGVAVRPTAAGTASIGAVAPGFLSVTSAVASNVTVTQPGITVNGVTVGSGLQVGASVSLGASQHGGVDVTISSGDPNLLLSTSSTIVGSSSISIFVPNNQTFVSFIVQALEGQTGTTPVTLTADASGFATGTGTVNLVQGAIDLINVPSSTTTLSPWNMIYVRTGIPNSQTTPAFLNQLQAVRAGAPGPLTATIGINDPNSVATLVQSGGVQADTLTVQVTEQNTNSPTDTVFGGVAVRPQAAGSATVGAVIPGFLSVTSAVGTTVNITQPGISVGSVTVGSGLQLNASVSLGATQHGGVDVTISSGDPNLLVAPNATTLGSSSITVFVPNGQNFVSYYVQALEGQTGTTPVTVTATAAGFATGTGTISLVQGAIDLINVPATTTTLSPFNAIYARVGIPNSQTTPQFLNQLQAVRFGAPGALTVTFNSSIAAVGDLYKVGSPAGASQTATIPVSGVNSPTDTTSGGVALRPILAGTTDISASVPGFLQVTSAATSTVNISQPGISIGSTTVGSGLQTSMGASLGAPNHGGVLVTLSSSNPALLLSPNATTIGTSSIQVSIPNGSTFIPFYVQGLEGQTDTVTAAITVTASGFTNGNGTTDVVPAAFDVIGLPGTATAGGADIDFYVRVGIANSTYQFMNQLQAVRAGAPASLVVTVGVSDQVVATLVNTNGPSPTRQVQIPEGATNSPTVVANGGVAFRPKNAGPVTVTTTIPGFIGTNSAITVVTVQ